MVKTDRIWFSVVCTLIDNDTRHHNGQNLLWTHEAQPSEFQHFGHFDDAFSSLIRVQTTLNHLRFGKLQISKA